MDIRQEEGEATVNYLAIILTFVFVSNVVFAQLLGLCPVGGITKRLRSAMGLGVAVSTVATVSSLLAWVVVRLVLLPLGIGFLRILAVVFIAAATAGVLEWAVAKVSKALYRSIGIFLPLVAANCAVVGIALIVLRTDYGPLESLVAGASGGAGTLLAMILITTLRERLESEWVPEPFRGTPITLISAGLIAMTFLAFDKVFLVRLIG